MIFILHLHEIPKNSYYPLKHDQSWRLHKA